MNDDVKRGYEWCEGEFNRAGDGMGRVELMPQRGNEASLLVLPLHEVMDAPIDSKIMELSSPDRRDLMMTALTRQNVHLKLHEVEELIEMLQSYVAWRRNK